MPPVIRGLALGILSVALAHIGVHPPGRREAGGAEHAGVRFSRYLAAPIFWKHVLADADTKCGDGLFI